MTALDIPSATTTWNGMMEWANPLINGFWPILEIILGIIVVFGGIGLIIYWLSSVLHHR